MPHIHDQENQHGLQEGDLRWLTLEYPRELLV